MIYITNIHENDYGEHYQYIENVWNIPDDIDVVKLYDEFINGKASEFNIVVHPKWKNVMDYDLYNSHLGKREYNNIHKGWDKFYDLWTIDKFISDMLKGEKLNYIEL